MTPTLRAGAAFPARWDAVRWWARLDPEVTPDRDPALARGGRLDLVEADDLERVARHAPSLDRAGLSRASGS